MAVKRITIRSVEIEDKPGTLQGLLAKISSANVDLLCLAAFSADGGRGKVYLSAKDPEAFAAFARGAGIETNAAAGFVISGGDKAGAAAEALKALAQADINGVAGAAMVCDGEYRMLVVVDAADGDGAGEVLGA